MRSAAVLALLFVCAVPAFAGELKAGAAAVAISPPNGTPMAGYYSARGSTGVHDDLFARALVLEKDGTKVALVTLDLISTPRASVEQARKLIEKETGIPGANVMISATHTHTGPALARGSVRDDIDGGASELGRRYTEQLPERIAESVAAANKKLSPVVLSAAVGKEEHLSFNRRFVLKDATVGWNPPKLDPSIVKPAGPIDPDVGVLYLETTEKKPLATYVNFAMHPDTVGGTEISADYPGVLARLLAEYKGKDMVTLFANGCCGNLNHRDVAWADPQKGHAEAKRIGTVLAGAVCRTYPRLAPVKDGPLQVKTATVKLDLAPHTEEDVKIAKDVDTQVRDKKAVKFLEQVKAYKVLDVDAKKGKPYEVEVQVITLGSEVAFVSLPGEIFVELGLALKKDSPFKYTMLAELANGAIGYIPDSPAYREGNYEVISARCAAGSGEKLVESAVKSLKELHKPR